MGDFNIKAIESERDRVAFYQSMLRDLEAFEYMLDNKMIEGRSDMIGAEQEICIVHPGGAPAPTALKILSNIDDERFTNELALYNLEVNLSPQKLTGDCFSKTAAELRQCMQLGKEKAGMEKSRLLLTGILPTLRFRHLLFDYMTPEERYKVLSRELLALRGSHFEIYLEGVDDFHATLDSVLFEACNTSFQLHLQIDPDEFAMMHNWAQMISGPVLSVCTNSPILFGKELWAENRIALFKQSLDTRGSKNHSRIMLPRVYFGSDWIKKSAIELWNKDVVRFPVLLRGYGEEDPMESILNGEIPKLKSIRLHNGTTYTWNRLCYGVANNSPHIRIECRYLPAGPTQIDEIANFAFWIGLMKGLPEDKREFWKDTNFRIAKSNFLNAARTGIQSVFHWFGENYSAKSLLLDQLIPMAHEGLKGLNIDQKDIDKYLSVIEGRTRSERTGSQWQKRNFRILCHKYRPSVANRILVQQMIAYQDSDTPVHEWEDILKGPTYALPQPLEAKFELVEDIMHRDVISVQENVNVEVIERIMHWKNIHHIPIENNAGDLTGLITAKWLEKHQFSHDDLARDVMIKGVPSVQPGDTIQQAKDLMTNHQISCLPVVEADHVVGILTETDFAFERENYT
jgi:CBS domain-containing protein